MGTAVVWVVMLWEQRFGATYRLHLHGGNPESHHAIANVYVYRHLKSNRIIKFNFHVIILHL
jgi:hypothetical protein